MLTPTAKSATTNSVLACTSDAFKSGRLEQMVSDFTTSYKIYWFKGIFDEVCQGQREFSLEHVAARMVASAWYPVNYFKLSFGAADQLANCVAVARRVTGLALDAAESDIIAAVEANDDKELCRRIKDLTRYVPFRIIRPFYDEGLADIRAREGKLTDRMVNPAILKLNREDPQGALYAFSEDGGTIAVGKEWADYLTQNRCVVQGWLDMKLVTYLQARNPSVPAIPLKIYPPQQRDLAAATKFWKDALALVNLVDIYSGARFTEENFAAFGPLSIDHFIPWSFVLHDEPWNLVPMFRNENSSKSDRLPNLDAFLEPFSAQQFWAVMAVRDSGKHRKYLESYLQVDADIFEYEMRPECRALFSENIAKAIRPLHQIASNQGFVLWRPEFVYQAVSSP